MADQLPQLDLSKSVPINQGGATATSTLPQLDLSKSQPINGAAPITAQPQATISAQPSTDAKAQQFAKDHPNVTGAMESTPVAGVLTMPLVKGLIALHDKLEGMQNLTQEGQQAHPIQAEIGHLSSRIEGLLTGNQEHPEDAIGTGKYGLINNPVTGLLIPGGEEGTIAEQGVEKAGQVAEQGAQVAKTAAGKVSKAVGILKNPAAEVQEGIANIAKDAGEAQGAIKPTAADPYGFRQVAQEQIGRYKDAANKLDELSSNAFSDAQQEVADAADDFTAAGKKAYREATTKLEGIINQYRPELEKAGADVDSMKADYKAAMANNKIATFLNPTTEETGKGAPMATAKLGTALKEKFLDLVQNQKGLLDKAGWTEDHINAAVDLARKLSSTATARKVVGGVASTAVGGELLHRGISGSW